MQGRPVRAVAHSAGCRVTLQGVGGSWTLNKGASHCLVLIAGDQPQKEALECLVRAKYDARVKLQVTVLVSQVRAGFFSRCNPFTWPCLMTGRFTDVEPCKLL